MKKLFERRVGAWFQAAPVVLRLPNSDRIAGSSWPFAMLTLYDDRIVIRLALQADQILMLHEIDSMEKKLFNIQLHHHSKTVLPYVYVGGMGNGSILFRKLAKAIEDNHLHIKVVR